MTTPEEFRAKAHAWFHDTTIYPTSECFCDVVRYFNEKFLSGTPVDELERDYRIVHGICFHHDGRPFSHAWIERNVIHCGMLRGRRVYVKLERDEFRRNARVFDETRYTLPEHVEAWHKTGMGGPWVPEYLELCNDYTPGDLEVCCFCERETQIGIYVRGRSSDGNFCRHPRDGEWCRHASCGICWAMRSDWRRREPARTSPASRV
jgi:hypothetical protein